MLSVLWRDEAITEGRKEGLEVGREEGLKAGLEAGREEGLKAGLEAGREEGRNEVLLKMITNGCSKDFVLDMGFTEEEYDFAVKD